MPSCNGWLSQASLQERFKPPLGQVQRLFPINSIGSTHSSLNTRCVSERVCVSCLGLVLLLLLLLFLLTLPPYQSASLPLALDWATAPRHDGSQFLGTGAASVRRRFRLHCETSLIDQRPKSLCPSPASVRILHGIRHT